MTTFKSSMILALLMILMGRGILGIENGVDIPYGYDESPLSWDEMAIGILFLMGGAGYAIHALALKLTSWVK